MAKRGTSPQRDNWTHWTSNTLIICWVCDTRFVGIGNRMNNFEIGKSDTKSGLGKKNVLNKLRVSVK